jgi:cytochrome c553
MKQLTILTAFLLTIVIICSCGNSNRNPGTIYMPDMSYSRAIETYVNLDSNVFTNDPNKIGKEIFYNSKPVAGTMRIGDFADYILPDDSTGYAMSAQIKNPLEPLSRKDSLEASRLFNINCAICHGAEGKANGPLSTKIGAIANLTNEMYIKMADGTMYHSLYYGKNNMGSYASQLSRKQRWQMVQYIRTLQPKVTTEVAKSGGGAATSTESTKMTK